VSTNKKPNYHKEKSLIAAMRTGFPLAPHSDGASYLKSIFASNMPDLNKKFKEMALNYLYVPISDKQIIGDYLGVALTAFDDPSFGIPTYVPPPSSNSAILRASSPVLSGSSGSAGSSGSSGSSGSAGPVSISDPIDSFSFDNNILLNLEAMNTTEKEEFMDEYNDLMVPQGFTSLPSTESTFDIYLDMIKNVNMYLLNYQTSKDTTVLTDLDIYYSGLPDKYNFTSGLDSLNPKRLIIIPVLAPSANGGINLSPLYSPFATEPATVCPFALNNLQISMSSVPIYGANQNYSYEQFMYEMNNMGVDANLMNGVVSSRISYKHWNNNYGYIVVNLARKSPEDELNTVSIDIQFKQSSLLKTNYWFYVEYEKAITINLLNGSKL
jgi:hypothetical protein